MNIVHKRYTYLHPWHWKALQTTMNSEDSSFVHYTIFNNSVRAAFLRHRISEAKSFLRRFESTSGWGIFSVLSCSGIAQFPVTRPRGATKSLSPCRSFCTCRGEKIIVPHTIGMEWQVIDAHHHAAYAYIMTNVVKCM